MSPSRKIFFSSLLLAVAAAAAYTTRMLILHLKRAKIKQESDVKNYFVVVALDTHL
jgi:hypothetical protein